MVISMVKVASSTKLSAASSQPPPASLAGVFLCLAEPEGALLLFITDMNHGYQKYMTGRIVRT